MPDGQTMVVLVGIALLIYGVHGAAVGAKKGVRAIRKHNPVKAIVHVAEHPKQDLDKVIAHEKGN